MGETQNQSSMNDRLRHLAVSFYSWIYAVYFGLILLDVAYARELGAEFDAAPTAGIFSEISDFLVFPFGLLFLSGFAALGAALKHTDVVTLLLVSWVLPVVLLTLNFYLGPALDSSGAGTALRLLTFGLGSVLAMLAFRRFLDAEGKAK